MSTDSPPSKPSEIEFDVDVPSEEMERKFEMWDEMYNIDNLTDMNLRDIEAERLKFRAKVVAFKSRYDRGRLVTPAMVEVAGKEPYTQEQLEEARRLIDEEAERIRLRFTRAKGIVEKEREDSFRGYVVNLVEKIQLSLFNSP